MRVQVEDGKDPVSEHPVQESERSNTAGVPCHGQAFGAARLPRLLGLIVGLDHMGARFPLF